MATTVLRSIGAIVLGLAVTFALLIAVEGLSAILHPWPEGFTGSREEVEQQVASYPTWILAFLGGVGYGSIMFVVTWLSTRLGTNRHMAHGACIGAIFMGLVTLNLSMLPYPVWFWLLMFTVLPVAAYLGTTIAARKPEPTQ